MQRALNPFAPGAGRRPPALVGREDEVEAFDTIIARAGNGLGDRGMVLAGLRGVGKTVLLNQLRDQADQRGWLVVSLEGQRTDHGDREITRRLGRELVIAARRLSPPRRTRRLRAALRSIESFKLQVGVTGISVDVDVKPVAGRADSGDLETDLNELIEDVAGALAEQGLAFGLFLDEMQDVAASTLSTILAAQHRANQHGLPFYVIGAGLPSLPAVLTEARSYAERLFDYRSIGPLPADAASAALRQPINALGPDIADEAVQLLVDASRGYPYFLQEYGQAVWNLAPASPITLADAQAALAEGLARLDDGFYRARWDRATPNERRLLAAMSQDDDGPSITAQIAERMGRPRNALGVPRRDLIAKGLVYAPEHGRLAYTVPGMAAFIARQDHDD